MEIGLRIKELREQQHISQNELAKKVKILSQSQICKVENGRRILKANELIEISKILSIPANDIFGKEE